MKNLLFLTEQYCQPHRKYHTLEHIAYMFNMASALEIELTEAQKLAIWWHDAVYVPCSYLNENDSVLLFAKHANEIDTKTFHTVVDIIWDTKHDRAPHSEESAIVCDLDMFGFASTESVRKKINYQIRAEFRPYCTPDEYQEGRTKFLTGLLDKQIFYSDKFKEFEVQAKQNINYDLLELPYER